MPQNQPLPPMAAPRPVNLIESRNLRTDADKRYSRQLVGDAMGVTATTGFHLLMGTLPILPTVAAATSIYQMGTVAVSRKFAKVGTPEREVRNNLITSNNMPLVGVVTGATQALAMAEVAARMGYVSGLASDRGQAEVADVATAFSLIAATGVAWGTARVIGACRDVSLLRKIRRAHEKATAQAKP